jgi:hypothetical protein
MLAVYAGKSLAFCRNEGMDEVLADFHARTGNGQNRRALTESYAGPQMRVNVLVDLWDEFCRKEIPRVGLDSEVWNVDAIRASSVRVGVFEPAKLPIGKTLAETMAAFPTPTHAPTLPDFIMWMTGPLAEQLTHAQPALAASEGDDPETLGQSKLQNANAMSSFGEAWRGICQGFAQMNTQAVAWNARVQPESARFSSTFPGRGDIQVEISRLKMGAGVARADGTANFPESWNDRQAAWMMALQESENPLIAQVLKDPRTLAAMKEFMPKGCYLEGVDSVEKQMSEFDILLKTKPVDNPQFLKLKMLVDRGTTEIAQQAAAGQQPDPQAAATLQQAQQLLQTMQPMISSVPVRPSDNDAVEALVCEGMLNAPEGRRLGSSREPDDQAFFQNLELHWNQHKDNAAKKAAANQQPIQPKTSIQVDAAKLEPNAQAEALKKMGIVADPQNIAQDEQLAPHEIISKEKGIGPTGSEIERTTTLVGKKL